MSHGLFICIEGPDGCGKTTIATMLRDRLRDYQRPTAKLVHDPGTSILAQRLRPIILDKELELSPTEQALLYTTARHSLAQQVRPILDRGGDVISDRWLLSTYVYQGMVEGADISQIRWLHANFVNINPDIYIVLDIDPETGIHRKINASEQGHAALDRFEVRDLEWRRQLRQAYLDAAELLQYPVIDASKPIDEVFEEVRRVCIANKKFSKLVKEF